MSIRLPSFEALTLSVLLAVIAAIISWLEMPLALNNVAHDWFQRSTIGLAINELPQAGGTGTSAEAGSTATGNSGEQSLQAPATGRRSLVANVTLDDILIVGIDEASLTGIGKWPWRRDIHGQLINRLSEAGVRAIAYDIVFAETDTPNPQYDATLVKAAQEFDRIVFPVLVGENKTGGQLVEVLPFDELADAAQLGHVHVEIDRDGVIRSTHLKEGLGTPYWEHMSLVLYRMIFGNIPDPLPGARAPDGATGSASNLIARDFRNRVRFSTRPNGFQTLSFIDILDGRYPKQSLEGKIVFVGIMAAGLSDTLATPVSGDNRHMQGVEINANIFQALVSGKLIYPLGAWSRALYSGALALVCLLLITSASPAFSLLITALLGLAILAVSFFSLTLANVWWPPISCLMTVLLGYPIWSWHRLNSSMRYLREELLSLRQEGGLPDRELLEDTLMWGNTDTEVPRRNVDVVSFHIDQIRRSHANRRQLRHFIFSCLANLSDGVVATSRAGRVVLINDRARDLLAQHDTLAHEHKITELLEGVVAKDSESQQKSLRRAIAQLYEHNEPLEIELRTGQSSELLLQGNEFELDGEHDKIIVFTLTDITRLREMERTRAETMNFVSHDLRSPLVSILALIERSGFSSSEEMLDIRGYAQRALSYTESFLQLARAENDNIALYECDLHSIADNAVEYLYALASRRNIQIQAHHCDDDVWIWGNGDLLERMIINLVENSIKYSEDGSMVRVGIGIERQAGKNFATVSVVDSGIGIPEKDLPHLFEQFRRGSSDESRTRKGAGLGLRFISVTAQRHRGTVAVTSESGQGSEFTVRLPLLDIESEEILDQKPSPRGLSAV